MTWEIRQGDALERLREMADESVQCCVTSPPYYGLRDYGVDGQLGLEETPEQFVAAMVEVFAEVRRVLRGDGTLWLNIGDSYWSAKGTPGGEQAWRDGHNADEKNPARRFGKRPQDGPPPAGAGIKPKDLVGIPWMVAFALRADGWYLRRDIIWAKPNPMPESVTDRPTSSHEYLFLLTKSPRYFYDADAIREGFADATLADPRDFYSNEPGWSGAPGANGENGHPLPLNPAGRNKRSVWTVATQPFSGWKLGDRRVPVASDDADGDTKRIASPDCPVHGDHPAPAPTASGGGHAGEKSSHSPRSTHLVQSLLDEPSPTGLRLGENSAGGSSDSPLRDGSPTATPNSKGSRKTASRSSSRGTASEETPSHTGCTSPSSESPVPDDSGSPDSSEIHARTGHKRTCTCEFYRLEGMDHFATFPPKLIEPCILAGSARDDTVLDPFAGAATTGLVATQLGRDFIGVELNPEYVALGEDRIRRWEANPAGHLDGDAPPLEGQMSMEEVAA